MIGRRGRLLVLLYVAFLAVLFLMCSTDWIIREPEKEVYQIAVIIEDAKGDNYSNFRKGMDQAAVEFNADVHFITLYEKLDAGQQIELMEREQQDGANALIVVPADEGRVAEKQMAIPVVFLRPGLAGTAGEARAGSIVIDYGRMGERLAQEMLEDMPGDSGSCPVFVLADLEKQSAMDQLFLEGANAVFAASGHSWQVIGKDGEGGFLSSLEAVGAWEGGKAMVLAESPEILTEAAGILADSPAVAGLVQGLYGRGSTLPILNYLDRGQIAGVCVTDEFSVGYLSVRAAVLALEEAGSQPPIVMDSYYIEKEDLRKPGYEKLLFPIE